jgi:hypothetical protein
MSAHSHALVSPAWSLVDEHGNIVASVRAATALEAREIFKEQGQSGARVTRAQYAPVDEQAVPLSGRCENPNCSRVINEAIDFRVSTWCLERIHRADGGTNAHRAPKRTDRYYCMFCADKIANGISLGQESLPV